MQSTSKTSIKIKTKPKRWARKKGRPACASGIIGMIISVEGIFVAATLCVLARSTLLLAVISRAVQ